MTTEACNHLTSLVWVCVLWLPWKLNGAICVMMLSGTTTARLIFYFLHISPYCIVVCWGNQNQTYAVGSCSVVWHTMLYWIILWRYRLKGLITVGRELRQQHPRDLLSGAGTSESSTRRTSPPDNKSRGCCCRNSRPTVMNPDYNMTKQRINDVFTTKYVQNHHQIERRRLLASIVTSRISP